jgi:hypothetical protein
MDLALCVQQSEQHRAQLACCWGSQHPAHGKGSQACQPAYSGETFHVFTELVVRELEKDAALQARQTAIAAAGAEVDHFMRRTVA